MTVSQNSNIPDELLSAYIDNAVTDAERRLIESAVATDSAVAWRLEALVQTVQLLNEMPQMISPRAFRLSAADLADVAQPVSQRPPSRPDVVKEESGGFWQWLFGGGNPMLRNAAGAFAVLFFVLLIGDAGRENLRDLANSSANPTELIETSAPVLKEALPTLTKSALAAPAQETAVIDTSAATGTEAVAVARPTNTAMIFEAAPAPQTAAASSQARSANDLPPAEPIPPANTPSPLATSVPAALSVPLVQADRAESVAEADGDTASTFSLEQPASDAEALEDTVKGAVENTAADTVADAADETVESTAFAKIQPESEDESAQDDQVMGAASLAITASQELPNPAAAQAQSDTASTSIAAAGVQQESTVSEDDLLEETVNTDSDASVVMSAEEPEAETADQPAPVAATVPPLNTPINSASAEEAEPAEQSALAYSANKAVEAESDSSEDLSSANTQNRGSSEGNDALAPSEGIELDSQNGFPLLKILQAVSGLGALLLGIFWWRSRASHNSPKRVQ